MQNQKNRELNISRGQQYNFFTKKVATFEIFRWKNFSSIRSMNQPDELILACMVPCPCPFLYTAVELSAHAYMEHACHASGRSWTHRNETAHLRTCVLDCRYIHTVQILERACMHGTCSSRVLRTSC